MTLSGVAGALGRARGGRAGRPRRAALLNNRAAWLLLSALYATAGALVISTTLLPAASAGRHAGVVQAMDAAALVSALVLLLGSRHLPRALLGVAVLASTAMITGAVLASGGGSTAVAYASVYLIGPVYCRFVLTQRAADVQLLAILGAGIPALALQPGVSAGEQIILWGVAVILCTAVSWLVQALQLAETDPLTGLPNRRGLERVLGEAIGAADRPVVLALLELDHFSAVNEALGREAGDRVLEEVARAWAADLPPDAVLGRTSGDGFGLVMSGPVDQATALVDQLRRRVAAPTGCSAGLTQWEVGESASMTMGRAETAVYVAKHRGRGQTYAHPGTGQEGLELRTALAAEQFVVHFQPIVSLAHGRVVGAEALVRWQHPSRGLVLPGAFLPEAERCRLMSDLGVVVLEQACRAASRWPVPEGQAALHLSVNASAQELQDHHYSATVERVLLESGLAPSRLVVELVEDDYDATSATVLGNLARLRQLGVRTAVDDFGVGHSSLDRLRRVGSDVLKIDRSFIADIERSDQDAPLVMAVLALARALGMRVIAEGVETVEQAGWLRAQGCALAQGWLYGAAVPDADFAALVLREAVPR